MEAHFKIEMDGEKMVRPILVTGANRRIGNHLATRLLQDGYQVIAHYRSATREIEKLQKEGVVTFQADLENVAAIGQLAQAIKSQVGSLRGIIHNASAYSPTSRKDMDYALEQYQMFFRVHMLAPFILNEELQCLLSNSSPEPADIIHITDVNADIPDPKFDVYCSTKAGLLNLSKSFAQRFAPHIKVNCVSPGPVLLPEVISPEKKQAIVQHTLLQKEGGAESVYLAIKSLMENPFITGTCLRVDGGKVLL